jgi:MFS family permease
VLLAGTYSLLMLFVIRGLGLLSGGLLPLASLGLADYFTFHRNRTRLDI